MKKHVLFCLITVLSVFNLAADPFSRVDELYSELQDSLDKPLKARILLKKIRKKQSQAIENAEIALQAIEDARFLITAGQGESEALQSIGYNSLYLSDNDRNTLGKGVEKYFKQLKFGYKIQNILSLLGPQTVVNSWFNHLRPTLMNSALQAPTEPAGPEYNYDVLTFIDLNVNLIRALDPSDPSELLTIQSLMETNLEYQLLAGQVLDLRTKFVDDFAPVLLTLSEERDHVDDPEALTALVSALPESSMGDAFRTIKSVYQTLADYLLENGTSDKDGYVTLYDQLRPLLIQASQAANQ